MALTPYITLTHLGQVFAWFRQRYPRVSVELADGLMSRVIPRLREGTLDLAVVAETGDLPQGEFNDRVIFQLHQHVAVRQGHPVLANPTPEALSQLEWVLTGPRDGLKSVHLRAIFERAGVAPPQQIAYAETLAALAVMRHGNVAGIIPAPLLRLPECRGMVVVHQPALSVGVLTLKLLTRPDVPLMPAAVFHSCQITLSPTAARVVRKPLAGCALSALPKDRAHTTVRSSPMPSTSRSTLG